MEEFTCLLPYHFYNLWMTMPGRNNTDAGGKIQKNIAVDVGHPHTLTFLNDCRVRTCI